MKSTADYKGITKRLALQAKKPNRDIDSVFFNRICVDSININNSTKEKYRYDFPVKQIQKRESLS